jgi:hypothetical protein
MAKTKKKKRAEVSDSLDHHWQLSFGDRHQEEIILNTSH